MPEESKSIDGCCRRGSDLNTAGLAKGRFARHPAAGHAAFRAQSFQGFCQSRVGIFRQPDLSCAAVLQGFSKLLGAHDDAIFSQIRESAALRYSTIFFSIHTKTYYTQFFKKVNKKPKKNSTNYRTSKGLLIEALTIFYYTISIGSKSIILNALSAHFLPVARKRPPPFREAVLVLRITLPLR